MNGLDGLDLRVFALALPLVMGAVQALKQAGLPHRWAGLAAVGTGSAVGALVHLAGISDGNVVLAGLTGAVAGMAGAGLWSGTKAALDR